ncbi:MAG TPA: hypothetical protein VIJ34_09800 [Acidimicrobiales bacterium]
MGADPSHVARPRSSLPRSLRRVSALGVGGAAAVVLISAAIVALGESGFLEAAHFGSARGPWLSVSGVVAAILCLGGFVHSMRGLRIGRPHFTQPKPGILTFDPWTRRVSLNVSLQWKNSNPEFPLQLSSVEIVRYRLDGVAANERIVGRMLTKPTLLGARAEGTTTMLFSLPAVRSPNEAYAEVVLRDELGRKHRTEVRFESPSIFSQGSTRSYR